MERILTTATILKALVVDDEAVARLALIRRLESITNSIVVCGEAENGVAALAKTKELAPDVVFLDVSMPGRNGFEVARSLQDHIAPIIVFLTAYGDRALEAFETEAVDYLTKPTSANRLRRAVERIHKEHEKRRRLGLSYELQNIVQKYATAASLSDDDSSAILSLDIGHEIVRINARHIEYIEAAGEYACVYGEGESHIVRQTLKHFEEKLPGDEFFRIHRQRIVNLSQIKRLKTLSPGRYAAQLECGRDLIVSRRKTAELRTLLSNKSKVAG